MGPSIWGPFRVHVIVWGPFGTHLGVAVGPTRRRYGQWMQQAWDVPGPRAMGMTLVQGQWAGSSSKGNGHDPGPRAICPEAKVHKPKPVFGALGPIWRGALPHFWTMLAYVGLFGGHLILGHMGPILALAAIWVGLQKRSTPSVASKQLLSGQASLVKISQRAPQNGSQGPK